MPVLSGKPRFLWQQIRYFFQEGVGFQKVNVGRRVARDDLKQCVGSYSGVHKTGAVFHERQRRAQLHEQGISIFWNRVIDSPVPRINDLEQNDFSRFP